MIYDPDDHRTSWSRAAGPLVLWAFSVLALAALSRGAMPAPGEAAFAAPLCGAVATQGHGPDTGQQPVARREVSSS